VAIAESPTGRSATGVGVNDMLKKNYFLEIAVEDPMIYIYD
jgi:hypothetical protein